MRNKKKAMGGFVTPEGLKNFRIGIHQDSYTITPKGEKKAEKDTYVNINHDILKEVTTSVLNEWKIK